MISKISKHLDKWLNKPKSREVVTENLQLKIAEIHNEFYTSAQRLEEQVDFILGQMDQAKLEKSERLTKLGFTQAKEVLESKETIEKKRKITEFVKSLPYYRQHYPLNKFITSEEVQTICAKYKLYLGHISLYKGFVPEKNLKDIENFKLREDDLYYYPSDPDIYDEIMVQPRTGMSGTSGSSGYGWVLGKDRVVGLDYTPVKDWHHTLQICAPLKDMSTHNTRIVGHQIIPDPVVLQPVEGGYLIVTAWGDEASDDIVVNQKMN